MMTKRMVCAVILVMLTALSAAAEAGRVECILKKREQMSSFMTQEATETVPEENDVLTVQIFITEAQIETGEETVQSTTSAGNTTAAESVLETVMNVEKTDITNDYDARSTDEVPTSAAEDADPVDTNDAEKAEKKTEEHVHVWKTDVIFHEAATHTVHHEEVTEQRWVSVPETVIIYVCDVCGKEFSSQAEVYAHEDATYSKAIETGDFSGVHTGHTTVFNSVDNGQYETVILEEARDETVTDSPAWEERHTYCAECGAEG